MSINHWITSEASTHQGLGINGWATKVFPTKGLAEEYYEYLSGNSQVNRLSLAERKYTTAMGDLIRYWEINYTLIYTNSNMKEVQ